MLKLDCLGFGLVTHDRMLMSEHFPRPNQKLVIKNWHEQVGGPVAVGVMAMAALGLRVHWGFALPPLSFLSNRARTIRGARRQL